MAAFVKTRSGCLRPSASVRQWAVRQGVGARTVRSTSFSLRAHGARPEAALVAAFVKTRSGCLRPSASVRQWAVRQGVGARTVRSTSFSLRAHGARPGGGTRSGQGACGPVRQYVRGQCLKALGLKLYGAQASACGGLGRGPEGALVAAFVKTRSGCLRPSASVRQWAVRQGVGARTVRSTSFSLRAHGARPEAALVAAFVKTRSGCLRPSASVRQRAVRQGVGPGTVRSTSFSLRAHGARPEAALVAAFVKTRSGCLRPSASVRQRAVRQGVGPGTVRSTSFSLRSPGGAVRRSTRSCVCKNAVRVPAAQCVSTSEGSASRCWAWNCTEHKLQPAEPRGVAGGSTRDCVCKNAVRMPASQCVCLRPSEPCLKDQGARCS